MQHSQGNWHSDCRMERNLGGTDRKFAGAADLSVEFYNCLKHIEVPVSFV